MCSQGLQLVGALGRLWEGSWVPLEVAGRASKSLSIPSELSWYLGRAVHFPAKVQRSVRGKREEKQDVRKSICFQTVIQTAPREPPNPYSSKRSWGNACPDAGQL